MKNKNRFLNRASKENKNESFTKKIIKNDRIRIAIYAFIILILVIISLNCYVVFSIKNKIIEDGNYSKIGYAQCIIVLGGGINGDKPSPLLEDRLNKAIELYFTGIAPKIIMSGDHGSDEHDEVNVMKNYAISKGVPSEDIFMDHAGFSTYDTMYRAKYVFGVKKAIIVTQEYHLFRSIYIANKLGINAYGVPAYKNKRKWPIYREIREVLARDKDFFKCIFKPSSKYTGEKIDITSDGNITNDK